MRRKNALIFILMVTAVFLAACGGAAAEPAGQAQDAGPVVIDVVANDIYFGDDVNNMEDPPVWTVEAGSTVSVNFENQGSMEHNWAVINLGEEIPVPFILEDHQDLILYDTGMVAGGEGGSFAFRVPQEPGEYTVICTVAGHYPSMQGRLIVN